MTAAIGEAVVLAAGNGTRLCSCGAPKPLVEIAGRPLIDHVVAALAAAGVRRVHVVTGHRAGELRAHAFVGVREGLVRFVHNPRHDEPNGLSLLAAEGHVRPPFLLLMSDHLFEPELLARLLAAPRHGEGGLLAIDRRIDRVFDPDDATRVATRGSRLCAIGKGLEPYDAVDTGVFALGRATFMAMRTSLARGDASLSGGIRVLAERGQMGVVDVGAAAWIDVDTPAALDEARRLAAQGRIGLPAFAALGVP